MAYDTKQFEEKELGKVWETDKSFIRVTHVTDKSDNSTFLDIRRWFVKNGDNTPTTRGVRIGTDHVSDLINVLTEFVNS